MKKREFGKLEVSEIGMGCMALSHGYGPGPGQEYSVKAIRRAIDRGCNFFDTAEIYGPNLEEQGHNERIVGAALHDVRERENLVLATKFAFAPDFHPGKFDLYTHVCCHLAASMQRLQTDFVDLYYLHRVDPRVPVEEVADIMGRLIKDGVIRGWGLSQVSVDTLRRAHAVTPVTAVQNIYNLLERGCEQDIFPYCLENDIGMVAFSPLASGYLSGNITVDTQFEKFDDIRPRVPQLSRENIAANQPVLDILNEYAQKLAATRAQVALAWMLYKYPNVVPIPGSKNHERIGENLAAAELRFTPEEFADLDARLSACTIHGHRGHVEEQGMTAGD